MGAGLHVAYHIEAVPSRGEDAEPLLVGDLASSCRHLAVFDGMGGAGARASVPERGHTQAYVAARLARDALRALLTREPLCSPDGATTAAERVAASLRQAFAGLSGALAPADTGSRVVSRMSRALPTTFALASVTRPAGGVHVRSLWAGDSRVYALTPSEGLLQLTDDHARYPADAFTSLYQDPPLANFVSADRAFYVDAAVHALPAPALVLAATDGSFGYWPSPMHFEEALVDSLCGAGTAGAWAEDLEGRVRRVAADDASLVGVVAGTDSLSDVAGLYRDRLAWLRREFLGSDAGSLDALRERWDRYRTTYESRLRQPPGAASPPASQTEAP